MLHRDHFPPAYLPVELLAGSVELRDGTWLSFAAFLPPLQPVWASRFALIALLTTAAAVAASVWAVRRATKPLSTLATAAERLGMDVDAPPMVVQGPREVRTAALAFNNMQGRLQCFVKDRTQMLAAISHDLRTPLTRMRLRAELVENAEDRDKMVADITDMEAMIAAALSFIRDEVTQEARKPVDLAALLESICDDAREAGADVSYEGPDHIPFLGRVLALKRAFTNLIDNAVTYGGRARLMTTVNADTVTVSIDDDGPGVPEPDRERVFEPFTRLDESRNRETGGMGLGLAVVRSVIRSHGGDVTLANRPDGGLRVTVSLPTGR
ncbi:MAG: HAMP domain-containing protein [Rhodospirillales bacterium]|nr:HAMP domain-containing protein [Rhodospirillales bacterium]